MACWHSEIGVQNRVLVIRAGTQQTTSWCSALSLSDDPFGVGDALTGWECDTYELLPYVEPMRPGSYGAFFEVRTYTIKPGGLRATIDSWEKALPGRLKLSPALGVMYSLTGQMLRFMHIWPYESLDERQRMRAQAVEQGVWPPKGGPGRLLSQQVDVYRAAAFSPIC